jgi:hypothetical protein
VAIKFRALGEGFSFRKSLKLGKLIRLNFSGNGVGVSAGAGGVHLTVNKNGGTLRVGKNSVAYRKKLWNNKSGIEERSADSPHPHEGQPFHVKGKDLGAQYHGGPVEVHDVDPARLQHRDRGTHGRGFYTTSNKDLAKGYADTGRMKIKAPGTVTVKKPHPDADILLSGEHEHTSHPDLVKAVKEFSPKYAKTGDMGMGDMTWRGQVNKFAEHHGYDAIRFTGHQEGKEVDHVLWKNHTKFSHGGVAESAELACAGCEHSKGAHKLGVCQGCKSIGTKYHDFMKLMVYADKPVDLSMPGRRGPKRAKLKKMREDYDFASTQLDLTGNDRNVAQLFTKLIDDKDLADKGREKDPHVTVKYGLHSENPKPVKAALAGEKPIKLKLGKTKVFAADDKRNSDVVVVDVESDDLKRLNKKISDAVPNTDTHPEYKPHMTLAYVKPGAGKKYDGMGHLQGTEISANAISFSNKQGQKTPIKLEAADPLTFPGSFTTHVSCSRCESNEFYRADDYHVACAHCHKKRLWPVDGKKVRDASIYSYESKFHLKPLDEVKRLYVGRDNDPQLAHKIPKHEISGHELGPFMHGTNHNIREINPERLNARDNGFFGKGFYGTKDKETAKWYGKKASRHVLQSGAKVLRYHRDVSKNQPEFVAKVKEHASHNDIYKADLGSHGIHQKMDSTDHDIATHPSFPNHDYHPHDWDKMVQHYADHHDYDAVHIIHTTYGKKREQHEKEAYPETDEVRVRKVHALAGPEAQRKLPGMSRFVNYNKPKRDDVKATTPSGSSVKVKKFKRKEYSVAHALKKLSGATPHGISCRSLF